MCTEIINMMLAQLAFDSPDWDSLHSPIRVIDSVCPYVTSICSRIHVSIGVTLKYGCPVVLRLAHNAAGPITE